jgi:hypothetical protein
VSAAVTFVLLREGTSDEGLVPHLRELLIRSGVDEVLGTPREYGGSVEARLRQVVKEEADTAIVFVHRDSDSRSSESRRREITEAAERVAELHSIVVPLVPIQELEAWLLLDDAAIRSVVGRPSSTAPLGLPRAGMVESVADPKKVLAEACIAASEASGRRLKDERRKFPVRRRVLLERLDIDGPVRGLSAWQELERDISNAVATWRSRT